MAVPAAQSAAPARRDRGFVAAVMAITALAFLSGVTSDFVAWDDDINFTNNPNFRGLGWSQIRWAFTTFHLGVYQPLAWLALELQFVVGGLSPAVYHLVSWLLHALNAALVYRLLRALVHAGKRRTRRCVRHCGGRPGWRWRERCCGRCTRCARRRSPGRRVSPICWRRRSRCLRRSPIFASPTEGGHRNGGWPLSVSTSPRSFRKRRRSRCRWPGWCLDRYPLGRLGGAAGWFRGARVRRVWAEKLPFLAVAAGAAIAAVAARAHEHHLASLEMTGVGPRLAHAAAAVWLYLGKTLAPWTLSPFYPRPPELARGLAAPLYAVAASPRSS